MDYINRDVAIEAITKVARKKFTLADWYEFYLEGMTDAEDSLKALPAADVVERKKGRWGSHGECPFCDYLRQWEDDSFCGNCGADLREE